MGRYCCSCSASGRCISCSCVKAGKKCRNCTPGRNFSCGNRQPGTLSSSQPSYTSIGECSNEVLPSSLPSTARINTTTEAEPNPRGVPYSASQCSAPAITGNVFQSSCRNDTAESESESDEFDSNTAGSSTTRTIRTTRTARSTAAIGAVIRDARIAAESVIAASPDIHENRSHLSIASQTPGTQRQDRRPAEEPRSAVSDQDATRILPEEHCADYRQATTCPRPSRVTVSAGDQHAVVLGPVGAAFAPVAGPSSAELSSAISANDQSQTGALALALALASIPVPVGGNVPSGDILAANPTRTSSNVLAQDGSVLAQAPTVQDSFCNVTSGHNMPLVATTASDHDKFVLSISAAYEEVIGWRRNLFIVPFGSAGEGFVNELSKLISAFADGSELRSIAWKAVSVLPHLLLQKSSGSRIQSNNSTHLSRRLSLWRTGRIDELVSECRCIQLHLPARTSKSSPGEDKDEKNDVVFSKLVLGGKLRSALRYLSPRSSGGVLGMSDVADESSDLTVRDVLSNKHPTPVTPPEEALLTDVPGPLNQIIFDRITPELIQIISRQMKGSSGLSGLDSDAWSRLLTSYKESSNRLCVALARSARCLCTEELNPNDLEAFTAARLIPLDKKPGVRPIAVGEVHRRIMCRAVMRIVEHDVLLATAPLQLCVGVPSACKGAVHAMRSMYGNDETEAILMVDASNAFNSLNRIAALHNVQSLCPPLARVFLNTYGKPIRLVVSGGGEVLSREGTCQGDPLAMAI